MLQKLLGGWHLNRILLLNRQRYSARADLAISGALCVEGVKSRTLPSKLGNITLHLDDSVQQTLEFHG